MQGEAEEISKARIISVFLCHIKDFDHHLQDSGWPFRTVVNKRNDWFAFWYILAAFLCDIMKIAKY